MKMKSLALIATWVLAWGAAVPCTYAATVPYRNLKQLVGESAVIVLGTVTGISYETNEKDRQVYTKVRLQQLKAVKGEHHVKSRLAHGITLSFWGGLSRDGTILEVVGMPELRLAHTYLVFLRGGKWTMNPITGWHQGIFQAVSSGAKGSQILLNLNGEVVMGVENDRLLVKALRKERLQPKTEPVGEGGLKIELRQSRQDLEQSANDLKDSIYREDRVAELEKEDEEREREAKGESPSSKREEKQRMLEQMLSGKPMYLAEFIAAIQVIDRRGQQEFSQAYRVYQPEPTPLPKSQKSLSPPSVKPDTPRKDGK